VHIVTLVLILAMTITLFITQLQLMRKNMPPDALTGPFAQQQKIMLYVFPLIFAVGGINFPVGVLIYWFTSNLWTMGQQFYVIRRNPAPGTPAYDAWEARRKAKGKADVAVAAVTDPEPAPEGAADPTTNGQKTSKVARQQPRPQPKKQTRAQRNTPRKR
jgi:YidC/Oxa1 family membrane protein insertase